MLFPHLTGVVVELVERAVAGVVTMHTWAGSAGGQLPVWMERVLADDLPALHSLMNGLSRDIDAVTAGLSTPKSSGQVEGQAQG